MKAIGAASVLLVLLGGCGSSSKKNPATPEKNSGNSFESYLQESGTAEVIARFRTPESEIAMEISIKRACRKAADGRLCETTVDRSFDGSRLRNEARTIARTDGVYELYAKDETGESTHDILTFPAPSRVPHQWVRKNKEGDTLDCAATRDNESCKGGIRVQCETPADVSTVVDARVHCPDHGKTLFRRTTSFSALCETRLDIIYGSFSGELANEASLPKPLPRRCENTTLLGWTHQTPNRAWSVAMPKRGRLVLGPSRWTVNLYFGDQSYSAYEGTEANASVRTNADIPRMVEFTKKELAPLLKVTIGEPRRRDSEHSVDWEIPLTRDDGSFGGVMRWISVGGSFYSLTATGSDELLAMAFLDSFQIRDGAFAAGAIEEMNRYAEFLADFRTKICACKDVRCAQSIPQAAAPTSGFPVAEQETEIAANLAEIQECVDKLPKPIP